MHLSFRRALFFALLLALPMDGGIVLLISGPTP